jgi:hypothetical protein
MRHRIRLAGGRFTRLLAKSPTRSHPRRSAADYSACSRRVLRVDPVMLRWLRGRITASIRATV